MSICVEPDDKYVYAQMEMTRMMMMMTMMMMTMMMTKMFMTMMMTMTIMTLMMTIMSLRCGAHIWLSMELCAFGSVADLSAGLVERGRSLL